MNELEKKGIKEEDVLFELVKLYADQYNVHISGSFRDIKTKKTTAYFDTKKDKLIKV